MATAVMTMKPTRPVWDRAVVKASLASGMSSVDPVEEATLAAPLIDSRAASAWASVSPSALMSRGDNPEL